MLQVKTFPFQDIMCVTGGWSQKILVKKISGPWHPKQRTRQRHKDCRVVVFH
jgi:hypothetical protein